MRAAKHLPDAPNYQNATLYYYLGFQRLTGQVAPHSALFDVTITAHILTRLLAERTVDDLLKLEQESRTASEARLWEILRRPLV